MVALALASYLAASRGVVALPQVVKKPGAPFPCQHHACGCATAQQCWDDCCCYSPAAKLAWAKARGITPPRGVRLAMRQSRPASSACCSRTRKCSHAVAHAGSHASPCADDRCDQAQQESPAAESSGKRRLVLASLVRSCRGLPGMWQIGAVASPLPAHVEWEFQWHVVQWLDCGSDPLVVCALSPPVPPPRI